MLKITFISQVLETFLWACPLQSKSSQYKRKAVWKFHACFFFFLFFFFWETVLIFSRLMLLPQITARFYVCFVLISVYQYDTCNANILMHQQIHLYDKEYNYDSCWYVFWPQFLDLKSISTNPFVSLFVQRSGIYNLLIKMNFLKIYQFSLTNLLLSNTKWVRSNTSQNNSQNLILQILSSLLSSFFPNSFLWIHEVLRLLDHYWINHYYISIITLIKQVFRYYFEMTNCTVTFINLSKYV